MPAGAGVSLVRVDQVTVRSGARRRSSASRARPRLSEWLLPD